ncbi:MAG: helix-turn-helix domain-containing protein [Methyloprofundus sp.]|nr:helix-turn-helix domain-containing protein [Methyloprofundus sp.]
MLEKNNQAITPANSKQPCKKASWLTLSEAQALLGVSRKTLYRYMDRQLFTYRKAANGRRYIEDEHLNVFIEKKMATTPLSQDNIKQGNSEVSKQLAILNTKVERQNRLLETMIELYKPESMHELLVKLKH